MKGAQSETRNTMYRVKILRGLFNSCNHKVEKILKGSLDLIPSSSPLVKIQIMG